MCYPDRMTIFRVVPSTSNIVPGWVVKTIHDNGSIDTSIVYDSPAKAQCAADGWTHLDEDWAKV
jgi:hypothetical protein